MSTTLDWTAIRERARAICQCEGLDESRADGIGPGETGEIALIVLAQETKRSLDWLVHGPVVYTEKSEEDDAQHTLERVKALVAAMDCLATYGTAHMYREPHKHQTVGDTVYRLRERDAMIGLIRVADDELVAFDKRSLDRLAVDNIRRKEREGAPRAA